MNKTVLVIDDDDILRNSLSKGLRNYGFSIIAAQSAEQASEILARISVDAIVLDRMMTGMDGLTFLKQLRHSGNNTPVIMLTAMTGAENTIDGLASGANDYLAKPFQLRELELRINNIIQHTNSANTKMPNGLEFQDNEFFVTDSQSTKRAFVLSGEEKKLLQNLTTPVGNIAPASPMVAKRLRTKLNIVLSHLDIITIRGHGYKLIDISATKENKDTV
ncbi:MAG: response regulator transcription factor [Alphaproteobacteria bacterium]|nr:response regulator transcription factor [Alphaproteobacteria bacterium]